MNDQHKIILLLLSGAMVALASPVGRAYLAGRSSLRDAVPGLGADTLDALNNLVADFDAGVTAAPFTPSGDVQAPDLGDASLDELFRRHGAANDIDPDLLKAVSIVESSLDPGAVSPVGAVGVMQILVPNRLNNIDGWNGIGPVGGRDRLFDPDFNIHIGAQVLKWNIDHYGFDTGIAIYNRWASRLEPVGKFTNQAYVDKVSKLYALIKSMAS